MRVLLRAIVNPEKTLSEIDPPFAFINYAFTVKLNVTSPGQSTDKCADRRTHSRAFIRSGDPHSPRTSSVSFIPKLNWLIDMLNREQIVQLIAWGARFDSLQATEQTSGWHRWRFPISQATLCLSLSSFSINIRGPHVVRSTYTPLLEILLNHRLYSVRFHSVNGFN